MPSLVGKKPNQVPLNSYLGSLAFQDAENIQARGDVRAYRPIVLTQSTTIFPWMKYLIFNDPIFGRSVTFPPAADNVGREIIIKTVTNQQVVSASANVCPLNSMTPGTLIVTGSPGKYARLVCDGTNWIIMEAN